MAVRECLGLVNSTAAIGAGWTYMHVYEILYSNQNLWMDSIETGRQKDLVM